MIEATMEWLGTRSVPNGLLLLALLTSPWTWAKAVREQVGVVVDMALPTPDE